MGLKKEVVGTKGDRKEGKEERRGGECKILYIRHRPVPYSSLRCGSQKYQWKPKQQKPPQHTSAFDFSVPSLPGK